MCVRAHWKASIPFREKGEDTGFYDQGGLKNE